MFLSFHLDSNSHCQGGILFVPLLKMFAKRAVKANSNKRKRIVDEDEELQRSGVVDGSIDNADDEAVITPIVDERRKLNTFSVRVANVMKMFNKIHYF